MPDRITVSVMQHRLVGIVHEMGEVMLRTAFKLTIPGTEETVSAYYMIACAFLPLAWVQRGRAHVSVEVFTLWMPPRMLALLDGLVYVGTVSGHLIALDAAKDAGCKLVLEPGRRVVAESGVFLTKVLFVKEGSAKTFVIVDAAMNDLIRPTLYEAHHPIVTVAEPAILPGRDALARLGFYVEPTSALVWQALVEALPNLSDPVVALLTGSGHKAAY